MAIYDDLKAAGVPLDHHESDLYAKVCPESRAIVARYEHRRIVRLFRSAIDGDLWYDIPFAYLPWWEARVHRHQPAPDPPITGFDDVRRG